MTTSSTIPMQLINQATLLQQYFQKTKEDLAKQCPSDQLIAYKQIHSGREFCENMVCLTDLQTKVHNAFISNTIPDISQEQIDEISEKLRESTEILESIESDIVNATSIVDISSEINHLSQNPTSATPSSISYLSEGIKNLIQKNSFMNFRNREALFALKKTLTSLNAPNENTTLIRTQNEDYQVTLFKDRWKNLFENFNRDPVEDFNQLLPYYIELNQYLNTTSFHSEKSGTTIASLSQEVKDTLERMCTMQAEKEDEQIQPGQGQKEQFEALKELETVIDEAMSSQDFKTYSPKIAEAFSKLCPDQKQYLFDTLNPMFKRANKRDLPRTLLGRPITEWPLCWSEKQEALKVMLSKNPTISSSIIAKKAEEMDRRLKEATYQQAQKVSSVPAPVKGPINPPSLDRKDTDISTLEFDNILGSNFNQHDPAPPADEEYIDISTLEFDTVFNLPYQNLDDSLLSSNIAILQNLKALLPYLQPSATNLQLQQACQILQILESKTSKCVFKMSDLRECLISDRPFFHIYIIHKNEKSHLLQKDMQYGNKAFNGVFSASNEDRLRAVQRTIVEVCLESLEDAINFDDGDSLIKILNILEETKLHIQDRVGDQENVAFNLFVAFYHLYQNERSGNPQLIDPQDPQFNGDFGRKAFRQSMEGIESAIKINAVNQVRSSLKAAWKV